jgi:hypothetical protein
MVILGCKSVKTHGENVIYENSNVPSLPTITQAMITQAGITQAGIARSDETIGDIFGVD